MSVSYVERDQADAETTAFYDKAEAQFQALLNIFKVFGHQPEYAFPVD
jgi:4-carboxymuconolactone decarboxylase